MATLTIKNIPEYVLEGLRQRAKDNRRSLNNEAITIFEAALNVEPLDVEDMLREVAYLHEKIGTYEVDPDTLQSWIDEGRP